MKKLLLFVIVLVLSQCQISIEPKEIMAQNVIYAPGGHEKVVTLVKQLDGMTYRIFFYGDTYAGGIHVINVTKEKLEIQKLKLEIKKLKE